MVKARTNISIDPDLLAKARSHSINISGEVEIAIERKLAAESKMYPKMVDIYSNCTKCTKTGNINKMTMVDLSSTCMQDAAQTSKEIGETVEDNPDLRYGVHLLFCADCWDSEPNPEMLECESLAKYKCRSEGEVWERVARGCKQEKVPGPVIVYNVPAYLRKLNRAMSGMEECV
jgi:hypothetical protein